MSVVLVLELVVTTGCVREFARGMRQDSSPKTRSYVLKASGPQFELWSHSRYASAKLERKFIRKGG